MEGSQEPVAEGNQRQMVDKGEEKEGMRGLVAADSTVGKGKETEMCLLVIDKEEATGKMLDCFVTEVLVVYKVREIGNPQNWPVAAERCWVFGREGGIERQY